MSDDRPAPATPPADFEKALSELETLVERLEQGELGLEESLALFERGVHLTRHCQDALASAEQRLQVLMEEAGQEVLRPADGTGGEPADTD